MSLRETIELWKRGIDEARRSDHTEAIQIFSSIPLDLHAGAKILFNISSLYMELGDRDKAMKSINKCLEKDPHLAIGYFQRGCLKITDGKFKEALSDFDSSLKNLRGNTAIDYKLLGLSYKLYSCDVIYNKGYCHQELRDVNNMQKELDLAFKSAIRVHSSISQSHLSIFALAISDYQGKTLQPFLLPKNAFLFSPPRNKSEVLDKMDFLGKATVVSSIVENDTFTGFVGAQKHPPKPTTYSDKNSKGQTSITLVQHSPLPSRCETSNDDESHAPPQTNIGKSIQNATHSFLSNKPSSTASTNPPVINTSLYNRNPYRSRYSSSIGSRSSIMRSPSTSGGTITVRVHYKQTKTSLYVTKNIKLDKLNHLICRKLNKEDKTISIWFKNNSQNLKVLDKSVILSDYVEDGFRLQLWVFDTFADYPNPITGEHSRDIETVDIKEIVTINDHVTARYSVIRTLK